eukprot:gene3866-4471_t
MSDSTNTPSNMMHIPDINELSVQEFEITQSKTNDIVSVQYFCNKSGEPIYFPDRTLATLFQVNLSTLRGRFNRLTKKYKNYRLLISEKSKAKLTSLHFISWGAGQQNTHLPGASAPSNCQNPAYYQASHQQQSSSEPSSASSSPMLNSSTPVSRSNSSNLLLEDHGGNNGSPLHGLVALNHITLVNHALSEWIAHNHERLGTSLKDIEMNLSRAHLSFIRQSDTITLLQRRFTMPPTLTLGGGLSSVPGIGMSPPSSPHSPRQHFSYSTQSPAINLNNSSLNNMSSYAYTAHPLYISPDSISNYSTANNNNNNNSSTGRYPHSPASRSASSFYPFQFNNGNQYNLPNSDFKLLYETLPSNNSTNPSPRSSASSVASSSPSNSPRSTATPDIAEITFAARKRSCSGESFDQLSSADAEITLKRLHSYKKVDMSAYSGYTSLREALSSMFGIKSFHILYHDSDNDFIQLNEHEDDFDDFCASSDTPNRDSREHIDHLFNRFNVLSYSRHFEVSIKAKDRDMSILMTDRHWEKLETAQNLEITVFSMVPYNFHPSNKAIFRRLFAVKGHTQVGVYLLGALLSDVILDLVESVKCLVSYRDSKYEPNSPPYARLYDILYKQRSTMKALWCGWQQNEFIRKWVHSSSKVDFPITAYDYIHSDMVLEEDLPLFYNRLLCDTITSHISLSIGTDTEAQHLIQYLGSLTSPVHSSVLSINISNAKLQVLKYLFKCRHTTTLSIWLDYSSTQCDVTVAPMDIDLSDTIHILNLRGQSMFSIPFFQRFNAPNLLQLDLDFLIQTDQELSAITTLIQTQVPSLLVLSIKLDIQSTDSIRDLLSVISGHPTLQHLGISLIDHADLLIQAIRNSQDGKSKQVLIEKILVAQMSGHPYLERELPQSTGVERSHVEVGECLFVLDSRAIRSHAVDYKDDRLHLTKQRQRNSNTSCWSHEPVGHLDRSFKVDFDFVMKSDEGQPADGFAFVIHNDPNGAATIGGHNYGGSGLGYSGIRNSLAVEFDNYPTSSDHMAIHSNGQLENTSDDRHCLASLNFGMALYLPNLLKLKRGNLAYVGFTAATGYCTQDVYIKNCIMRTLQSSNLE